jgi:predicted enzyme related to lactoylglutathione lyase
MSAQIMTSHQIEEVSMFDHVSIGVRDLARAKHFYDAALRPIGYVC